MNIRQTSAQDGMDDVRINVINADLPQRVLDIIKEVYNHPQTNEHTRHVIRFELHKLFGREYDIYNFLKSSD